MNKIYPFNNVVFRQPAYNLPLMVKSMSSIETLRPVLESNDFKMALLAASPELYAEFKKWLDHNLSPAKAKRMQNTAVKYFERMCTRCTPFGRFSYCSLGHIGSDTRINNNQDRHTTLLYDYNLSARLCSLVNKGRNRKIYVNPTIHKIADKFHFQKQSANEEIVDAEVRVTDLMQKVIDITAKPSSIPDIISRLQTEFEIDDEICLNYLKQLTDIGLLIPFTSPQTIGSSRENFTAGNLNAESMDLVNQIAADFSRLSNTSDADTYFCVLSNIQQTLKSNHLAVGIKSIVQTDTFSDAGQNSISEKAINEIIDFYGLISSVTPVNRSSDMVKFEKDYMTRYEGEKSLLLEVLNPETGIGYGNQRSGRDPLLKCIRQQHNNRFHNFTLTDFQMRLITKILSDSTSRHRLELSRQDFTECSLSENAQMGLSFAALCKLFSFGDKTLLCHPTFNGGSAANLLARFAPGNNKIRELVNEIMTYEDSQSGSALCEISYLPSLKSGNVLRRTPSRKNYINYMCKTDGDMYEIPINDIGIQIKNGKVELSSMTTGRRIEPRLTSAYNYPKSLSSVFRFLCDYEFYGTRAGLAFNWGGLNSLLTHFPRVKLGSIVLAPERWRIKCDSFLESGQFSMKKFSDYCDAQHIPSWINLMEGDNTLFVDLKNPISSDAFANTVKTKKTFEIEEFIPTDNYNACDSIAECIIPLKYSL